MNNRNLLNNIHYLIRTKHLDITWVKVKDHDGIFGNEEADRLAHDGRTLGSFLISDQHT